MNRKYLPLDEKIMAMLLAIVACFVEIGIVCGEWNVPKIIALPLCVETQLLFQGIIFLNQQSELGCWYEMLTVFPVSKQATIGKMRAYMEMPIMIKGVSGMVIFGVLGAWEYILLEGILMLLGLAVLYVGLTATGKGMEYPFSDLFSVFFVLALLVWGAIQTGAYALYDYVYGELQKGMVLNVLSLVVISLLLVTCYFLRKSFEKAIWNCFYRRGNW